MASEKSKEPQGTSLRNNTSSAAHIPLRQQEGQTDILSTGGYQNQVVQAMYGYIQQNNGYSNAVTQSMYGYTQPATVQAKPATGQPSKNVIQTPPKGNIPSVGVRKPREPILEENEEIEALPSSVQRKLTIGAPNDPYEQEADAMADQVMRMTAQLKHAQAMSKMGEDKPLQRMCNACKEEMRIQRAFLPGEGIQASNQLSSRLQARRGQGSHLAPAVQAQMEQSFGRDFNQVRIHTDTEAVQMSQDLNAQAFTHGSDIYFNKGKYEPESSSGKRLLAHELTHTMQQNSIKSLQKIQLDPLEEERYVSYQIIPEERSEGSIFKQLLQRGVRSGSEDDTPPLEGDVNNQLIEVLPAVASILDADLNLDQRSEIVNVNQPSHPNYYNNRGIDTIYINALWDFYKARWESANARVRRRWINAGKRKIDNLLRVRTLNQYILSPFRALINQQITSLIISRIDELRNQRDCVILSRNGTALTTEESESACREAQGRPRHVAPLAGIVTDTAHLPGAESSNGRGWRYGGGGSRQIFDRLIEERRNYYQQHNYPDLKIGVETFKLTSQREGGISAINTWDGLKLTWGVGFSYYIINSQVWPNLDQSVKSYLIDHVPTVFSDAGIIQDEAILDANRKNAIMISALIYVAENEPYATKVFDAQCYAFLKQTMGMQNINFSDIAISSESTSPIEHPSGQHYFIEDPSLVYFFARLAHYSTIWQNPRDSLQSLQMAGNDVSKKSVLFAACINILSNHIARNRGRNDVGGRRIIPESVLPIMPTYIARWTNRIRQFDQQENRSLGFEFGISDAQVITPSFSNPQNPYLIPVPLENIPSGHIMIRNNNHYYDLGNFVS